MRRRRRGLYARMVIPNYFRLTSEEDSNTITIGIGASVTTTHLKYLEYSLDEGVTWTRKTNSSSSVSIQVTLDTDESVLVRGDGIRTANNVTTNTAAHSTIVTATGSFKASGVLMTLLLGNKANENTSIGSNNYTFARLFYNSSKLTSVEDLIFPPDVSVSCYRYMFNACTSLTKGPVLPATTLTTDCYRYMFSGCTKINYIKMLATDVSASNCLYYWLPDTRTGMLFHRSPSATWWIAGKNGIPAESILFDDTEETAEEETFIDSEVHRIVLATYGNKLGGASAYARWKNNIKIGGVDNKILKKQLANVISIFAEFRGNTVIEDFSDLTKFTGLTYIGAASLNYTYSSGTAGFAGCTNLKYITIPNTVISICGGYVYQNGCFYNTAIESIVIPDSVQATCNRLFDSCAQLKTVRWSSNLPTRVNTGTYYTYVFNECSNLETITNYPQTGIVPNYNFYGCSKLDLLSFLPLLQQASTIGNGCIQGTKVTNLPTDIILYNVVALDASASPGNLAGIGRRRLFLPRCTTITNYGLGGNAASLVDLGNVTGSYFYPGRGNSTTNTITVVLRSTAVPTFSTFNKTNVRRIYVYSSIIDAFKADSKCSTAASITFAIGGTEWVDEFGSSDEWADYPNGISPFN